MIVPLTCDCTYRLDPMPAALSARTILWISISLLAISTLVQAALDFVYRTADPASLQAMVDSWWFAVLDVTRAVFVPLGPLMLAAFFVARAIERRTAALAGSAAPAPRINAGWVFVVGVALTLFGVLLSGSLDIWLRDLNALGRTSLALDALNLVVVPMRTLLFPLGLALLPASVLMKKLEAPRSVEPAAPAAAL